MCSAYKLNKQGDNIQPWWTAFAIWNWEGNRQEGQGYPHARIMIHQPLIWGGGISGQVTDIEIEARELRDNKEHLLDILAKHTGQDKEKIRQDSERNYYMSAQEAKAYGLIDEVLELKK